MSRIPPGSWTLTHSQPLPCTGCRKPLTAHQSVGYYNQQGQRPEHAEPSTLWHTDCSKQPVADERKS